LIYEIRGDGADEHSITAYKGKATREEFAKLIKSHGKLYTPEEVDSNLNFIFLCTWLNREDVAPLYNEAIVKNIHLEGIYKVIITGEL